jgi:hypothetical protein
LPLPCRIDLCRRLVLRRPRRGDRVHGGRVDGSALAVLARVRPVFVPIDFVDRYYFTLPLILKWFPFGASRSRDSQPSRCFLD